jgi:hypothetical protein
MDLLDNGGRVLGQWPPFPLEHFAEKWNSLFGPEMRPGRRSILRKNGIRIRELWCVSFIVAARATQCRNRIGEVAAAIAATAIAV